MAKVPNAVEKLLKFTTAQVGARALQTDVRQTDDRQTDGRQQIANVNVSSRWLKMYIYIAHHRQSL